MFSRYSWLVFAESLFKHCGTVKYANRRLSHQKRPRALANWLHWQWKIQLAQFESANQKVSEVFLFFYDTGLLFSKCLLLALYVKYVQYSFLAAPCLVSTSSCQKELHVAHQSVSKPRLSAAEWVVHSQTAAWWRPKITKQNKTKRLCPHDTHRTAATDTRSNDLWLLRW